MKIQHHIFLSFLFAIKHSSKRTESPPFFTLRPRSSRPKVGLLFSWWNRGSTLQRGPNETRDKHGMSPNTKYSKWAGCFNARDPAYGTPSGKLIDQTSRSPFGIFCSLERTSPWNGENWNAYFITTDPMQQQVYACLTPTLGLYLLRILEFEYST